jgi:GntR family transcriptional repressor for pyruvate dehydrogenase complex
MEVALDYSDIRIRQDLTCHAAVAQAAHNPLLLRVLESIADLFVAQRKALLDVPGAPERSVVAHRKIYEAIAARNAAEAARAIYDHLAYVKDEFSRRGWGDPGKTPLERVSWRVRLSADGES